jgi:hypothetical protein
MLEGMIQVDSIVTWLLKAGIVKSEWTFIVANRFAKHFPVTADLVTMELEAFQW